MCQGLVTLWLNLTLEPVSNKCSIIFCLLYFNLWRSDTRTRKFCQVNNLWMKRVCSSPTPSEGIFLSGSPLFLLAAELCILSSRIVQPFAGNNSQTAWKNKLLWWLSLRVLSPISISDEEIIAGPDFWWVLSRIYNLYCENCQRWKGLDEGADCSLDCGSSDTDFGWIQEISCEMFWWCPGLCAAGWEPAWSVLVVFHLALVIWLNLALILPWTTGSYIFPHGDAHSISQVSLRWSSSVWKAAQTFGLHAEHAQECHSLGLQLNSRA